ALVAGAATLLSQSAAAQQTMHPVIITANRVEQRVQDTLADVTVVDREQIETAAQSTLTELLARQPGIQMTSQGGPGASTD
ncbi:TonB-dependent receptor plug domain-containing protein, partial [Acinetobacter baumannii]